MAESEGVKKPPPDEDDKPKRPKETTGTTRFAPVNQRAGDACLFSTPSLGPSLEPYGVGFTCYSDKNRTGN